MQAATTTAVDVTAGKITATVAAESPGAGTPTGTVTFLVADDVVGEAPLVDGIAELQYDVPPGSDAKVSAEYAGDSNFTDSSDSITRRDPPIDASLDQRKAATRFGWYGKPVTVRFTCTAGSAPVVKCPERSGSRAATLMQSSSARSTPKTAASRRWSAHPDRPRQADGPCQRRPQRCGLPGQGARAGVRSERSSSPASRRARSPERRPAIG